MGRGLRCVCAHTTPRLGREICREICRAHDVFEPSCRAELRLRLGSRAFASSPSQLLHLDFDDETLATVVEAPSASTRGMARLHGSSIGVPASQIHVLVVVSHRARAHTLKHPQIHSNPLAHCLRDCHCMRKEPVHPLWHVLAVLLCVACGTCRLSHCVWPVWYV